MNIFQIEYTRLGYWSHTDLAYLTHDPLLSPFLGYAPAMSSFPEIISRRKGFPTDRKLLYSVLTRQYENLGLSLPVAEKVLLDENTFTITTSHQPTLFTGPLFHIYKIASAINLARKATASSSGYTILPVFVLGGEDHDWAEINHLHLFGRRYEWQRSGSGPGGRLSVEGLDEMVRTFHELFLNSPFGNEITALLETSLQKAKTYGEFHQLLIHGLFGHLGLIILNMDDPDLKRSFIPLMEKEIREQFSFHYVTTTQTELAKAGFKPQAFCRPVNLFYMTDQRRERIDPTDDGFIRVETGIKYSPEELIAELHQLPDLFSPNVILRPLYQESILPNLVFVGGGGEIAYWLERKSQFEAAGIHYPMLIRRNSLMMIDNATQVQLDKVDLLWEDLLQDYDSMVKSYLVRHSQSDLDYVTELESIKSAYQNLARKAENIDPTLAKAILAEESKQSKQFEQLGSRLMRAEKQLQETNLKRIQKLKEKLFPEGGLQERYENFLPYYAQYGKSWIDAMVSICDPLDEKFTVVQLEG